MNGQILFTGYLLIALIITAYLTKKSKTEYRLITFIMIFWIFAGSLLSQDQYIFKIKGLFFELQADRIILLIFTIYYIILWSSHRKQNINEEKTINPLFEKFLLLFLILYLFSNIMHLRDVLTIKDLIASYTRLFSFPIIYLIIKKTVDEGMVKSLITALLMVCIISSFVGIYQFLVDPEFFRYGSGFLAFTGKVRANGIFRAEYVQGCYLISGLAVVLTILKNKVIKFTLFTLFLLAIIFTFHRASWIITLTILFLYIFKIIRLKIWQFIFVSPVFITFILLLMKFSPSFFTNLEDKPVVTEGIMRDTVTGRFALYNMAFSEIPKYLLFGVGSPKSEIYYHSVMRAIGSEDVATGLQGGIHNLYIQTAFFFGLPTAIIFTIFIILIVLYFWKKAIPENKTYFIPLAMIMAFMMINLSNMFYLYTEYGLLLAIFLGMFIGLKQPDAAKILKGIGFKENN